MGSPIARSLGIGVASRIFSLAILMGAFAFVPAVGASVAHPSWSRPFAVWDGAWFVGIASNGYHSTPIIMGTAGPWYDIAFFPLWPAVIWVTSIGGLLPPALVAGIVSNLLFVAACPVMYRSLAPRLGSDIALWGVALIAFSPAAFVFSLAYSESLFLLLAALAFVTLRARWVILAQLTRLPGIFVGMGAAFDALGAGRRRQALALVAAPIVAFVGWLVVCALIMGRPDGYLLGSPSWYASGALDAGPITLTTGVGPVIALFLGMLAIGAGLVLRGAPGPGLYAIGLIAAAVILGRSESMPRLALCAFPAFAGLALVRPGLRLVIVVAFAVLEVVFTLFGVVMGLAP